MADSITSWNQIQPARPKTCLKSSRLHVRIANRKRSNCCYRNGGLLMIHHHLQDLQCIPNVRSISRPMLLRGITKRQLSATSSAKVAVFNSTRGWSNHCSTIYGVCCKTHRRTLRTSMICSNFHQGALGRDGHNSRQSILTFAHTKSSSSRKSILRNWKV